MTRLWRRRRSRLRLDAADVRDRAREFAVELAAKKAELAEESFWYPYGSMANFEHLDALLAGPYRDLAVLAGEEHVADLGGQDGDCSFFLERLGYQVDLLDNPPTNFNSLRGARMLRDALASSVEIHEVDLDRQFTLPRQEYGLALFFGILYHLKNPFYALETLARHARYCLLSTKVARFGPGGSPPLADLSVAYLVDERELNDDPTNFWIFTPASLERILRRAGWEILSSISVGNTEDSDPVTFPEKDERTFCLLRSIARA